MVSCEGMNVQRPYESAVIAAHYLVALEPPLGERQQPVPAGVFEGDWTAVAPSVEHDLLVRDRAREQLVPELRVPGDRIPGIQRECALSGHGSAPSRRD